MGRERVVVMRNPYRYRPLEHDEDVNKEPSFLSLIVNVDWKDYTRSEKAKLIFGCTLGIFGTLLGVFLIWIDIFGLIWNSIF